MDRRAWRATDHGAAKSQTILRNYNNSNSNKHDFPSTYLSYNKNLYLLIALT